MGDTVLIWQRNTRAAPFVAPHVAAVTQRPFTAPGMAANVRGAPAAKRPR